MEKKRFIILSDIHGNYEALKASVDDAINNYHTQISGFILLGDYTCDFLEGHEVIELIKKLKENYSVYAINGNREGMVKQYLEKLKNNEEMWSLDSTMGCPLLCCQRLTDDDIEFLLTLPSEYTIDIPGCDPLFLTHKMPLSKDQLHKLEEGKIKTILTGHTHEPHEGKYSDLTLYNPGAVALSDIGVSGANYGIVTWYNNKWHFETRHIDYNYEKEIQNIKNEPLLFEKCKNWGEALIASIKTGINIPALYMFEAKRLAKLKVENIEEYNKNSGISENVFGIGRYGNVSPYGSTLKEEIIQNDNNGNYLFQYQQFKTDEGIQNQVYPIDDEIYMKALKNVLDYVNSLENTEIEVYNGRRTR